MVHFWNHKEIKTGLGSFLAYVLADYFGLKFGLTASIIAILTIQSTRSEGVKITGKRLLAIILGLLMFFSLVGFFGYGYLTLGLFTFVFMPLCNKLKISDGFMVTTVLATHILSEKSMSREFLINEAMIVLIGLSVGNIMNLYMPTFEKEITKLRLEVNKMMKDLLLDIAETLRHGFVSIHENDNFQVLKSTINKGEKLAIQDYDNNFLDKCEENLNYFDTRRRQYKILKRMRVYFSRLYVTYDHSIMLSKFIREVSNNLDKDTDTSLLLEKYEDLKVVFAEMNLPETREEFENRATLYQLLEEMSDFLNEQIEFETLNREKHSKTTR